MMRRLMVVAVVLCGVLCGVSVPALAQEGYVGGSFLSTSSEFDTSGASFNPSADGWKLFAGYNANKYFGIEASYYDMGNLEDTSGSSTFAADINIFDLSFRGILPLGKVVQLTAKIGYSSVDIDSKLTGNFVEVTASGSTWELVYGVGAEMKLGKHFGLRGDWEKWDVEGSLDAWSVGAFVRF